MEKTVLNEYFIMLYREVNVFFVRLELVIYVIDSLVSCDLLKQAQVSE